MKFKKEYKVVSWIDVLGHSNFIEATYTPIRELKVKCNYIEMEWDMSHIEIVVFDRNGKYKKTWSNEGKYGGWFSYVK